MCAQPSFFSIGQLHPGPGQSLQRCFIFLRDASSCLCLLRITSLAFFSRAPASRRRVTSAAGCIFEAAVFRLGVDLEKLDEGREFGVPDANGTSEATWNRRDRRVLQSFFRACSCMSSSEVGTGKDSGDICLSLVEIKFLFLATILSYWPQVKLSCQGAWCVKQELAWHS